MRKPLVAGVSASENHEISKSLALNFLLIYLFSVILFCFVRRTIIFSQRFQQCEFYSISVIKYWELKESKISIFHFLINFEKFQNFYLLWQSDEISVIWQLMVYFFISFSPTLLQTIKLIMWFFLELKFLATNLALKFYALRLTESSKTQFPWKIPVSHFFNMWSKFRNA